MGYGLMGAGAAVSGLMSGYQQGRKFAIEEEEAEDRKALRGLQMRQGEQALKKGEQDLKKGEVDLEEAGLRLGAAKRDLDLDKADQEIVDRAGAEIQAWNNRPPATPGAAAPVEGRPAGITPPGGAAPPARNPFQVQQDMYARLLENSLKRRGTNKAEVIKQMLGGARMFKMAETQATLDAMSSFEAGTPQEQIFAEMAASGRPVQEGTTMRVVQKPLYEGSKQMVPDVEIALPNGQVVSRSNLARTMLDPKQLMDLNTEQGRLMAQVSHYAATEEIARTEAKDRREQAERHHSQTMARINEQIRQNAAMYNLSVEKFQWDKFTRDQGEAQKQFENLFGYRPLTESDRLKIERDGNPGDPKKGIPSDLEKAESRAAAASRAVSGAMLIYSMNIDPRTLKAGATPGEIKNAIDTLLKARDKPELIKRDDLGRAYVLAGGNRVLVPAPEAPAAAPAPAPAPTAAAPAAPAPAPAPTGPGIPNPSNPYVDSRGNRIPNPPPGPPSIMSSKVVPAVGRAAEAAGNAVSSFGVNAPVEYLRGKMSRGEKLSPVEEAQARRYGLIK